MSRSILKKLQLMEAQKGIYFDCQIDNSVSYNISAAILLKGKLHEEQFTNALKLLIVEQEALRCSLKIVDDLPVLVIYENVDFSLEKQDFSDNPTQRSILINRVIEEEVGKVIDLFQPPLFRAKLVKLDADEYLFIICIHHIVSDGMSLEILKRKVLSYYHQLVNKEGIVLRGDTSFSDFIDHENSKLRDNKYSRQKDYWMLKMHGAVAPVLLTDKQKLRKNISGMGKEKRFVIPSDMLQSIDKSMKDNEATIFTFFLAAFSIFIGRYACSEDVLIATPFSYRPSVELEETIGYFIHLLPLRFSIKGDMSFSDLLKQGTKEVISAYTNIGYPNNLIIRDSHLASVSGGTSIFDITFAYDIYEESNESEVKAVILNQDIVTFPGNLMVILANVSGNYLIKFQYKPNVFLDKTIEILGQRFLKLLEKLSNNVNIKIADIDLLLANEKQRILNEFNDTNFFPYEPQNIVDIFHVRVKKCPSRVAIIDGDNSETYASANFKANQLARKISRIIKKSNMRIGIQLNRSMDMVISILAVLKIGCAYIPIDPGYPRSRKEFIFKDAEISLLLTSRDLYSNKDWCNTDIIFISDDIYTGKADNITKQLDPFSLAYIIYTSGSTGKPKGIMIENHSVVNTLLDLERRFPVGDNDVFLLKTSYTFDICATELFGWFMGEGCLCVLEQEGEKNPQVILDTIAKYNVTHINFVPTLMRPFLELFDVKANIEKLRSIKWLFIGGEPVTNDILQKFYLLNIRASMENMYGPTECTIWSSTGHLKKCNEETSISIGTPINATRWYVVSIDSTVIQPIGIAGELCISGVGLARGYLNQPELTKEKFVPNPFFREGVDPDYFKVMYRTGDLVRWLSDGTIEFLSRIDFQVKIQGVRLELEEIENALENHIGIVQAVVVVRKDENRPAVLCAYYTAKNEISTTEIRRHLSSILPSYMIPSFFIYKKELPVNSSGKVNRNLLLDDAKNLRKTSMKYFPPGTELEKSIAAIWQEVLAVSKIGLDDNFFEVGGHSVLIMQVHNKLRKLLQQDFSITLLFQLPTIRMLAEHFSEGVKKNADKEVHSQKSANARCQDIAVIGMSVHVPGAQNVRDFWCNLKNERESIHFYSDEELRKLGVNDETINAQNYIKARGRLDDIENFDANFFDYTPTESYMMSPQLRLLYRGVWEALEDAGYFPGSNSAKMGVFLGSSDDFEWYNKVFFGDGDVSDKFQAFTLNTNHFIATRIAYKLDTRGPAFSTLTGCSTSLVTSHLAYQSLILGECDIAIAGGITIELPNEGGYFYEDGMMFSADGHCRPFDARATGAIFSNGMGLVVLKRLDEAIRDKDHIYAVIKGSVVNNDGKQKVGFTAPSVNGQVAAIKEAYQKTAIDPETISYVEAHGTGTILGDPIEVESLTKAFASNKKQFCALGSVKGNVGHTDTAAGVVSLVKVALSLEHKYIPGTVNFTTPNPRINFNDTPFVVNAHGMEWKNKGDYKGMLRAGVNSFGIGGTNAHMILEEYVDASENIPADGVNMLIFSAKTPTALAETSKGVVEYLLSNPNSNLSDAAWTLQIGRKPFPYRSFLIVNENFFTERDKIIETLISNIGQEVNCGNNDVYFMFPGQGSQYQGMGRDVYYEASRSCVSRIFKKYIDEVFVLLTEDERNNFLDLMYGDDDPQKINSTENAQFALFATGYALAKTLIAIGVVPKGMLGHSIGEITAATVAGVFELRDAVSIVRFRGQVMQEQEPGVMLAVMSSPEKVMNELNSDVWLALENTTNNCVVGGSFKAVECFEEKIKKIGWHTIRIRTSHAFHTPMMTKAALAFRERIAAFDIKEPQIPIISNVSGTWISKGEMTNPEYWSNHICQPIKFTQCLAEALKNKKAIFVEMGASNVLSMFAAQHEAKSTEQVFINLLRHPKEIDNDVEYVNSKLAQIWCAGVNIDWNALNDGVLRKKISLPTYVFDKIHFPFDLPIEVPIILRSTSGGNSTASNIPEYVRHNSTYTQLPSSAATAFASQSELESKVVDAYKEVLGFDEIGVNQDFFALGGDSLKAVSLVRVLKKILGIKVDIIELFSYSSPNKLAEHLLSKNLEIKFVKEDTNSVIKPTEKREYYPLSSAQHRMYTMYLLDRTATAYNLPSVTKIVGKFSREQLEKVLGRLIECYEPLRTAYVVRDGRPVQVICDTVNIPLTYCRKDIITDAEINQLINDFIQPFELDKPPLFRVKLIEVTSDYHIMFFDIHHIVADGTAMEIFSRDFSQLLIGDISAPTLQYKDFAVWQGTYLKSEEIKEQEKFWLEYLGDDLPVLEFPTDFARPPITGFEGSRNYFTFSKELSKEIIVFSRKVGVTVYMLMLSVWSILLARYSGQEDIVVGTPISSRTQKETEGMFGMFVNMLAMRNYPENKKRFIDFLHEVKENALNAFKNQDYQFDTLLEQLNVKRSLDRNTLFDVCFDYQNMEVHDIEGDAVNFIPYQFKTSSTVCDLLLTCQENKKEQRIDAFIDYSTRLFKEETIVKIFECFCTILTRVMHDEEGIIGNIDLMSEKDRQIIFTEFNNTTMSINNSFLICDMFEQSVNEFSKKIALVVASGKKFTFSELNEKANNLAWYMMESGVGKDSLVGIMLNRDEYLLISLLAVLKVGGAYVPIDPSFPQERIDYMFSECRVDALICSSKNCAHLSFAGKIIDCYATSIYSNKNIALPRVTARTPSSLACVLFTSGSTGKPKGVMLKQSSIVNFIYDVKRRFIQNQDDSFISVTTVSFDAFIFDTIVPLCTGHTVYLTDENEQLDPALAGQRIVENNVTVMFSTVSRLKAFIDNSSFDSALQRLRCIIVGGESYPLSLLQELQQRTHARLYNIYGPTETTVWVTAKDLTHAFDINIGRPISNSQIYIINSLGQLQPVGVFGELCIAGYGLSDGYINNATETSSRFVQFASVPNTTLYRTGDRARFLPNGEIELSGRFDYQVKINGFRVELLEIETVALQHEKVDQVAATVFEDDVGNKRIALYYCLRREFVPMNGDDLWFKDWLKAKLPNYMIPASFILLDKMPMLPNGKIDRRALIQPRENRDVIKSQKQASLSTLEKELLAIWKEVLSVNDISTHDNFFDVGGNSLGLIYVDNKISAFLGYSVPLLQLFTYPTIESLAKSLHTAVKPKIKEHEVPQDFVVDGSGVKDVAVIGMCCRFPGADNVDEFWQNVLAGVESITVFNTEELLVAGVDSKLLSRPNYVKAKGFLANTEYFDADFFDYSPQEASIMDPQIRILHECIWHLLETAGYNPYLYKGRIGLFAGSSSNISWMNQFANQQQDFIDAFEAMTFNEKDFLTTRISYKLNLKGPSLNIQTACSTSLVAIHQAVQSLIKGESDMAIAGGVSVSFPAKEGYLWHEGMIFSQDAHCRPFSENSSGIVSGDGCGVVLLKSLDRAIQDGDQIYAIIKGSAINNDGIEKIGFTAPSISGQASVIRSAIQKSGIMPEEICYVEAHGTATKIGDPIEIEALKQAWNTDKKGFCAIGSVKANIGHLDAAAGVAGFIKAVLTVHKRAIPPLVNFTSPNPRIDFADSPFYINTEAEYIEDVDFKLRAAVSSFGMGGTNAHIILEQPPLVEDKPSCEDVNNLLIFSAKSATALINTCQKVLRYIEENPQLNLSDVAWTLQVGRAEFNYRKAIVLRRSLANEKEVFQRFLEIPSCKIQEIKRPVVFVFSEEIGNNQEIFQCLYNSPDGNRISTLFSGYMDSVISLLIEEEREYFTFILNGGSENSTPIKSHYDRLLQFALDYSVAKTLITVGISPDYLLGGWGEISALVIAGCLDLANATAIVRSNCIQQGGEEPGAVASVIRRLYSDKLDSPQIPIIAKNIKVALRGKNVIFAGINSLCKKSKEFIQKHLGQDSQFTFVNVLVSMDQENNALVNLMQAVGDFWCLGIEVNWHKLRGNSTGEILSLPFYVFDKVCSGVSIGQTLSGATQYANVTEVDKHESVRINNRDALVACLSSVWSEIFGHKNIKAEDDFFALGGNSLKAISLATKIKQELNIEISLSDVFSNSTFSKMIEILLSKIGSSLSCGATEVITDLEKVPKPLEERKALLVGGHADTSEGFTSQLLPIATQDYYPASSAQKRMYAVNAMIGDSIAYNFAIAQLAEGAIDKNKFKKVIDDLVRRHESFRTRFAIIDDDLVQIVEDSVQSVVEFKDIAEEQIEDEIANYFRPFDLSKAPLFRIILLSVNERKHILLIDMHHIISDQTSIAIFLKDFADLYQGKKLPPLTIQYKDFAVWQNNMLQSKEIEKQYMYWKKEFAGEIPVLNFPIDYVRPPVRSFDGGRVELVIGEKFSTRINSFVKENNLTRYMIFIAALNLMLWKYTGQNDLVVGTAVAGRRYVNLDSIVGMFVNTLAIRSQINKELTIAEYLQYIKEKLIEVYENQDCQFEELLNILNLENDLSKNPLFDVVINYINMGTEDLNMAGVTFKTWPAKRIDTKFDLTFTVEDRGDNYIIDIEYNISLFRCETIELLIHRFRNMLELVTTRQAIRLVDISLLTENEKKCLLSDWNNTDLSGASNKSIMELFDEQVVKIPNSIAVTCNNECLTYRELNQKANQLAHYIDKIYQIDFNQSFKVGEIVGLYMERSIDALVSILAILKMGGAYLPLDLAYPEERLRFIIDDANLKLVITRRKNSKLLPKLDKTKIICVDVDETNISKESTANLKRTSKFSDLAYVMYTSGSTGYPKGVMIEHKSVIRLVKDTNYIAFVSEDRVAHASNISFDAATLEIWGSLLNGACLVCVDNQTLLDRRKFSEFLVDEKVDILWLTAALFERYAVEEREMFKGLKYLLVGGDVVSSKALRLILESEQSKPKHILNGYGPTENTTFTTTYMIKSVKDIDHNVPIGNFIKGTFGYVVDENLALQPIGVIGELYVGGLGLARGYLNQPALTKERFIENPFLTAAEKLARKNKNEDLRIYKTGDRVRWSANGYLEFIGRADFQIKIRGFRVELEEIENQIRNISGVKEVVVLAKKDSNEDLYMACYYTVENSIDGVSVVVGPEQIKEYLSIKIPTYMVPTRIMKLEKLPLNSSGKVNRKALPNIDCTRISVSNDVIVQSDVEKVILEKMRKILDNSNVEATDDFFNVGGHSIKAIVLVQSLLQQGINIAINEIFQYPTAQKLAVIWEQKSLRKECSVKRESAEGYEEAGTPRCLISLNEQQIESLVKHVSDSCRLISDIIVSANKISQFNLAPVQKMTKDSNIIFSGFTEAITGDLDEQAIKKILTSIIYDNQLMHSVISGGDNLVWHEYDISKILSVITRNLPYLDVREYDEQTKKVIIERLNVLLLLSPYYKGGILSRCCCLRLDRYNHLIIWGVDHVAFDGMSAEIMRRQINDRVSCLLNEGKYPSRVQSRERLMQRYQDYVALLEYGPQNIDEERLIKIFCLDKWSKCNFVFMDALNGISNLTDKEINIKIALRDSNFQNIWEMSLELIIKLLRGYTGLSQIPLAIVNYGRKYGNMEFYNCLGEFLDIIPLLMDRDKIEYESCILAPLNQCQQYSINFLSLLFDDNLSKKYPVVNSLLASSYKDTMQLKEMVIFNFQGFISQEEKNAFHSSASTREIQEERLAKIFINSSYDREYLNIEVSFSQGVNIDCIKKIKFLEGLEVKFE